MNTQHPAVTLLAAVQAVAGYEPTGPEDLAYLLRTLNNLPDPDTVLDRLGHALDTWANLAETEAWPGGGEIAEWLRGADEHLQAVATFLDRARAATGYWDGTEGSAA